MTLIVFQFKERQPLMLGSFQAFKHISQNYWPGTIFEFFEFIEKIRSFLNLEGSGKFLNILIKILLRNGTVFLTLLLGKKIVTQNSLKILK